MMHGNSNIKKHYLFFLKLDIVFQIHTLLLCTAAQHWMWMRVDTQILNMKLSRGCYQGSSKWHTSTRICTANAISCWTKREYM